MKLKSYLLIFLLILLLITPVIAQTNNTTTTTTTPPPPGLGIIKGIYNYLISANPIVLLILGIILIVASTLAKWVGIVLIIIALIHLLVIFLG